MPVKFVLTDASGNTIDPGSAPRWITPKRIEAAVQELNEGSVTLDPSTGDIFKASGDGWQFNWKTNKAMAGYRYRIGALLDDGTSHIVDMVLK